MSAYSHQSIQSLIDGTITHVEFEKLQDEMEVSPELRKLYYDYVSMEQGLEFSLARNSVKAGVAGLAESRLKRQRTRSFRVAMIAAAAVMMVSLVVLSLWSPKNQSSLAFASSPGSQITLTHDSQEPIEGSMMAIGSRLQISQGTVELNFGSGVRGVIEAPADITLHEYGKLFMDSGKAWFHVPEGAEGFTVKTREVEVVDLGTEFGVITNELTGDQVHVLDGRVAIEAMYGEKSRCELTAGMGVEVRASGQFTPLASKSQLFVTELPKALPHLHFSFDSANEMFAQNTLTNGSDFNANIFPKSAKPKLVSGPYSGAYQFGGDAQFVETNWEGILKERPRTVALWVKMDETRAVDGAINKTNLVGWGRQTGGSGGDINFNQKWTIHLDHRDEGAPVLNMSFGGFWYYTPDLILDDSQWHHVAVVYSGESDSDGAPNVKLYFDGVDAPIGAAYHEPILRDSHGAVEVDTYPQTPLVIGTRLVDSFEKSFDENGGMNAAIDELYIIEGALDEADVQKLYDQNVLQDLD